MPWTVHHFDEIDSTNTWALSQARAGAPAGTVAVASYQSSGRGRLDRAWNAPAGSGLLVSVLLRQPLAPERPVATERAHLLTLGVALAMSDAVRATTGLGCGLKWPNDLLLGDRKVAGVLAEAQLSPGAAEPLAVVVGAGLNLHRPESVPTDIGANAVWLDEKVTHVDGRAVLDAFLLAMSERGLDRIGGVLSAAPGEVQALLAAIAGDARGALATIGQRVRIDTGLSPVVGTATDVDQHDGALIVVDDQGTPHRVVVGDVVHLRPA